MERRCKQFLLTECARQFALAADSPDRIRKWLEVELFHGQMDNLFSGTVQVQFAEQTHETVRHHLQRASAVIRANVCVF